MDLLTIKQNLSAPTVWIYVSKIIVFLLELEASIKVFSQDDVLLFASAALSQRIHSYD